MPRRHASRNTPALDHVDAVLINALQRDARSPGSALAKAAGVSESTCSARLRALRERGVITGFHAAVNPLLAGWGVQAMVAVRLSGQDRATVDAFISEVAELHGVLAVYNVSGANDFLVHVVAADASTLSDFVLDHITGRPLVVHVETSMVFTARQNPMPIP